MKYIYDDLQGESNDTIRKAQFVSIYFDGSTDTSVCENELVYARVVDDGVPKNVYIRMEAVEHANAVGKLKGIEDAMSFCPDWKDRLIATGSDGASVNIGKKHSVTALLKKYVPHLIPMHCVNNRLELSVLDALNKKLADVFAKIKKVLQLLYNHYHRSPKALREFKYLVEAIKVKMLKPAKMNGTRWMPHLFRALSILLKNENYKLYTTHFKDIIKDGIVGARCQGRAKKILKFMKSQKLMHYMHFLLDVLEVLSELSLEFQHDSCSIPDVVNALDHALTKMMVLQQRPGKHLESFINNTSDQLIFQGVKLIKSELKTEKIVTKENALAMSVIDHISERVTDLNTPVMKAMQIFFLENLPEEKQDITMYGEKQIATLCDYFHVILKKVGCQVDQIIRNEWIALKSYMYKRRGSGTKLLYKTLFTTSLKEKFKNILVLVEIILVIPTSSAICERGLFAMARIKSDWRSKLGPEMLDYLMSITINGPPIDDYNCAKPYIDGMLVVRGKGDHSLNQL